MKNFQKNLIKKRIKTGKAKKSKMAKGGKKNKESLFLVDSK